MIIIFEITLRKKIYLMHKIPSHCRSNFELLFWSFLIALNLIVPMALLFLLFVVYFDIKIFFGHKSILFLINLMFLICFR